MKQGHGQMMARTGVVSWLWWGLWGFWLVFTLQQIADVARFNAPWPMWILRVLPLIIFIPGVARGSLRAVVWLCFVLLFYFVSSVELIFAKPEDPLAVLGLVVVVALFVLAALYIRLRGPQLRAQQTDQIDQPSGD